MKRIFRVLLVVWLLAALVYSGLHNLVFNARQIDSIVALSVTSKGGVLASIDGDKFLIEQLNNQGAAEKCRSLSRRQDGRQVSIADMAVGEDGALYLLRDLSDPYTGELERQELAAYATGALFGKTLGVHDLSNEAPGVRFRWLSISSSVILMGTDANTQTLTRVAYETAAVGSNTQLIAKNTRNYPLLPGEGIYRALTQGTKVLSKLLFSALAPLVLALLMFGAVSYSSYSSFILTSYQKQVEDEGNLLTALFGTESFDEIEYPYDYTGEAYTYLSRQMATREAYTRTAYYERGDLYTGVDSRLPCFYPFSITCNSSAEMLHWQAAVSGSAAIGIVDDNLGRRVTCVTPIGGVCGDTVYLLETGIFSADMERYTSAYIKNYLLVSAAFLLVIGILLFVSFRRRLAPLGQIRKGLEEFSHGSRGVRLKSETEDEFAGISRVFNKMAGEIEAQLYNLRQVSETYRRFVPPRIFQLLGKDNLGDLQLGESVTESYCVLCAALHRAGNRQSHEQVKEQTNKYFSILNTCAEAEGAILLTDSADLRELWLLCPGGADSGVKIALSALAAIDAGRL